MDRSTRRVALVCVLSLLILSGGLTFAEATSDHQFDSIDGTVSTNETVEGTNETLDESTPGTGDNVTETTGEVEETATETTENVDDAVDSATTQDGTDTPVISETTASQNDTVDETIDALDETGDDVEGTVDETIGDVQGAVNEATDGDGGTEATKTAHQERDQSTNTAVETVGEAGDGPEETKTDGGTSRNERHSEERVTNDVRQLEGTANGSRAGTDASGDESPGSPADVTIASLLAILASSATLTGSSGIAAASTVVSSSSGHVAFRALRTGLREPWEYAVSALRYSPYEDSDPLEHEHRRTIYRTIAENPGVYLSKLGESSDVSLSTVRHHLHVLERENLIKSEKVRGKRRFYPVEVDNTALVAALADPAVRSLLEALAVLGEARNDRLVEELGRSPSTVSHHLTSLEEDGLVVRERRGRSNVNRLAPGVASSLVEERTGGDDAAVERGRPDD